MFAGSTSFNYFSRKHLYYTVDTYVLFVCVLKPFMATNVFLNTVAHKRNIKDISLYAKFYTKQFLVYKTLLISVFILSYLHLFLGSRQIVCKTLKRNGKSNILLIIIYIFPIYYI